MAIIEKKLSELRITNRRLALLISAFLVLLCILLTHTYRTFIYKNNLDDFHFADTITSWLCIPAASLFLWGVSKSKYPKCLISSLIGLLIYEFIGLTFDWYDVIALLLSSGITYLLYIIYKKSIYHS